MSYSLGKTLQIYQDNGLLYCCKKSVDVIFWRVLFSRNSKLRFCTLVNHTLNRIRYRTPPPPFRRIWVDDSRIVEIVKYDGNGNHIFDPYVLGQIKDGNWDILGPKKSLRPITQSFMRHYREGVRWRNTAFYKSLFQSFRKSGNHKKLGFDSVEDYLD